MSSEAEAVVQRELDSLAGLIAQKRHAEADVLAHGLLERDPAHGRTWFMLGASLHGQGRAAEAVAAFRRAVAAAPQEAAAHYALGEGLMSAQQPAEAAESYRRAVALRPAHADAHFKLGNALVLLEQLAEAVHSYRRALALRPEFGEAQANLGFTLVSAGRYAEAEPALRLALNAYAGSARVHQALGVALYAQGRPAEAEASFRRVLALAPAHAEAHANLGNALRDQQRYAKAEASYRQAMACDDGYARVHFDLGGQWLMQERHADAEQSYRRALQLRPDYAEACNNLGRSIRKQGRLDEARACFEATLAIDPGFLEAYCNLAPLRSFAEGDAEPPRFEAMAPRLAELPDGARIRYWFALGKMREDLGRYDEAFEAYQAGNRLQHARFPPDEAGEQALIERLQRRFDAAFFANRSPVPSSSGGRTPIFIVGMPRSGTSLIEQILSTYPGIHGAGELVDLDEVVRAIATQAGQPEDAYPELAAALSEQELQRVGEAYRERVWRLAPQAGYITDKMMSNFLHVGLIHLMLPGAKIIHAMRDPMDSCFSCYSRLFVRNNLDYTYDLGSVGRHYVRYMQLMQHWHRVLPPGSVLDLHYEAMVADTEGQARRLLDYLGLPWDARCLAFHQNQRVVNTASAAQVRKPIYRSSVARWKRFEAHLGLLQDIVQAWRPSPVVAD